MAAPIELCWDLNGASASVLNEIEDALHRAYGLGVEKRGSFTIAPGSLDSVRKQYPAGMILDQVRRPTARSTYCLAVVDVDLYTPGRSFVFGQANQLDRTAIVSLSRLKGDRLISRTRTEVVHEVGHLLGLGHCSARDCVMFLSNSISDTDRKGEALCASCHGRLSERL